MPISVGIPYVHLAVNEYLAYVIEKSKVVKWNVINISWHQDSIPCNKIAKALTRLLKCNTSIFTPLTTKCITINNDPPLIVYYINLELTSIHTLAQSHSTIYF